MKTILTRLCLNFCSHEEKRLSKGDDVEEDRRDLYVLSALGSVCFDL